MNITKDNDFSALKTQISGYKSQIEALQTSYTNTISTINSTLSQIDLSGWTDAAGSNLSIYVEDLKSTQISNIKTDISTGNCNKLIEKIQDLIDALDACKSTKTTLSNKKSDLRTENNKSDDQKDSSKISTLESGIRSCESSLDSQVSTCNTLLTQISQIKYGGTVADSPAIVPFDDTASTPETTTPENGFGSSAYPVGRTETEYDIVNNYGADPSVASHDTTYYVVDNLDLGSGPLTYYFASEEAYKSFITRREQYLNLINNSGSGQPFTIEVDGREVTITDMSTPHGLPDLNTFDLYQTTTFFTSNVNLNVVQDYSYYDAAHGDIKFYTDSGEEYSLFDIVNQW